MLELLTLTSLATYALSFAFRTLPFLEPVRNFIANKISQKLVECVFCQSFWLSSLVLLSIDIDFELLFIVYMLAIASLNYFIENIIFKE